MVGGFVGQARHEDERDVGQEPTGKPVQPADSPRNQMLDVSLGVFIARRCDLSGGRHEMSTAATRKITPRYVALPHPVQPSRPAVFP